MKTNDISKDKNLNEYLEYLDDLRESGITNMFGATPYLVDEFNLTNSVARNFLSYWMKTFSERHKKEIKGN